MSLFNQMVADEQRILKLLDTFVSGHDLAKQIITDEVKKETVEKKMIALSAGIAYERGARAYYNKYGTVGEF